MRQAGAVQPLLAALFTEEFGALGAQRHWGRAAALVDRGSRPREGRTCRRRLAPDGAGRLCRQHVMTINPRKFHTLWWVMYVKVKSSSKNTLIYSFG